jgi:hypothetical protein
MAVSQKSRFLVIHILPCPVVIFNGHGGEDTGDKTPSRSFYFSRLLGYASYGDVSAYGARHPIMTLFHILSFLIENTMPESEPEPFKITCF